MHPCTSPPHVIFPFCFVMHVVISVHQMGLPQVDQQGHIHSQGRQHTLNINKNDWFLNRTQRFGKCLHMSTSLGFTYSKSKQDESRCFYTIHFYHTLREILNDFHCNRYQTIEKCAFFIESWGRGRGYVEGRYEQIIHFIEKFCISFAMFLFFISQILKFDH